MSHVSVKVKSGVGFSGGAGKGTGTAVSVTLADLVQLSNDGRLADDGTTIALTYPQFALLATAAAGHSQLRSSD